MSSIKTLKNFLAITRHKSVAAAARDRTVLLAPAAGGAGARRAGDFSVETKSGRTAVARGVGPENRLQPLLSEPDFFRADRPHHHPASAPAPDGARGGTTEVGQVQRHRGRAGGGLFEPEPFQPGIS